MHLWCLLDILGKCRVRVDVALNPADWSGQSLDPGNDPVSMQPSPFYSSSSVPLPTRLSSGSSWSLICMPKNCIYILNHCCVRRASFDNCKVLNFRFSPSASSLLFSQHDFLKLLFHTITVLRKLSSFGISWRNVKWPLWAPEETSEAWHSECDGSIYIYIVLPGRGCGFGFGITVYSKL